MVLRPQSAALSNPNLRSPKNPKENFKLKRNLRWPTTRTLDLPSSTKGHGGSLSLIGRSVQNLLQWTFGLLLAHTIYGRLEAKLTSLIVRFYFRQHNNIRLLRIRGKLNINPNRLSACTWLWGDVFNEEIPQGDFLDFIFSFLTCHICCEELTVGLQ